MNFIRSVKLEKLTKELRYVSKLPAVKSLAKLDEFEFISPVTYFVGENGSGKSTLLEALAVKYGFNAEGGSLNFSFSTKKTHSPLHSAIKLARGIERPKTGFFLRAESFYNAASYIDTLGSEILGAYGGVSLHEQSHGESFFSLVLNRFIDRGLYILDEPEAALSPSRQLSLLIRIKELADNGSQFIIATHSPIVLACPNADIYELSSKGIVKTAYEDTETYSVMKAFMDSPERMIDHLFEKE
ncbi:MAG: AAA family ATPase [Ruminococcus sp.]|uniref:AAA family ATPase n=1 Tax=Ruminococcus sp. TaxID=41978 RepID=UPI0025CB785F|nr:AAA family ATPase [Ruminococcus sp.]MCR5599906.1 AAA family ATPase [Ruminococcus sp.]